jgi:acyl carrier protein
MVLVAELEDRFDVMLSTDDVLDMSSFSKALEILSRHGIIIE